jgi:hypothetical protein
VTEDEWRTGNDPLPLIEFLWGRSSDRKLRLFAVCCCRLIWKHIRKRRSRAAVDASERYAEELIDAEELAARHDAAYAAFQEAPDDTPEELLTAIASDVALQDAVEAARTATGVSSLIAHFAAYGENDELPYSDERQSTYEVRKATENSAQCCLLRDIFGNPFRPVSFSPEWRTDTAVSLARQMYESRDFSAMPILADALQDAGCDSAEVLNHCRNEGAHVRGCWVVDRVLGKE